MWPASEATRRRSVSCCRSQCPMCACVPSGTGLACRRATWPPATPSPRSSLVRSSPFPFFVVFILSYLHAHPHHSEREGDQGRQLRHGDGAPARLRTTQHRVEDAARQELRALGLVLGQREPQDPPRAASQATRQHLSRSLRRLRRLLLSVPLLFFFLFFFFYSYLICFPIY